ncbi:MAG TPA: hypothetical protein ENH88_14420 [Pseudoalteromonas prydzensis]|uniref:Uncharacterized protein n=1 Tax=Pseudoalteromonas prydzensis TaxID=182141 RepID=A0A7V1D0E3_9GAMM|nr:hypothetical protein [Pseudoalteromonas prydzensis]
MQRQCYQQQLNAKTIKRLDKALQYGASRRTSAVYAIMQMVLPLIGFILAWGLPKYFFKSARF